MREAPTPPESTPPAAPSYDLLIGGIVSLVIGLVSEGLLHPIVPWTYMPGTLFVMIGIGIVVGVTETRFPREGKICYYVTLAGVALWFFQSFQSISLLAPMLFSAAFQLTKWALKVGSKG